MRTHLTVVGGGISGLIAAIAAREHALDVTLHEARAELGGRARTARGAYLANWGPHVIYSDGPLWAWLDERALAEPARRSPALARVAFRVGGRARPLPPLRTVSGIRRLRRQDAPVHRAFIDWAAERLDDAMSARQIANAMGVVTFHHNPGELSAAFVNERLRRATTLPPKVRYIPGGWSTLVHRLAERARALGARIELRSPVDRLPDPPVVLAVPLPVAAALLDDPCLTWTGARTGLLDVGLTARRLDPFVVSDLDGSGWVERFSMPDPSLAPPGESLLQCQMGIRIGEAPDDAIARVEALLDATFPRWRERETWRRRLVVDNESGAIDLPGTSWRDRPAGDRGGDVHLVGDMVAAPGVLAEVSFNAAIDAVGKVARTRLSPTTPL